MVAFENHALARLFDECNFGFVSSFGVFKPTRQGMQESFKEDDETYIIKNHITQMIVVT